MPTDHVLRSPCQRTADGEKGNTNEDNGFSCEKNQVAEKNQDEGN